MAGPFAALLDTWEREHAATLRVVAAFPARRWNGRPHPRSRTAAELARHIAGSERWFCGVALGLGSRGRDPFARDLPPAPPPALLRAFRASHRRLARAVRARDARWLRGVVSFYDLRMPRHRVIDLMVRHEVHHRGQLTVLVRLAGGKVPAVYGDSADEPSGDAP